MGSDHSGNFRRPLRRRSLAAAEIVAVALVSAVLFSCARPAPVRPAATPPPPPPPVTLADALAMKREGRLADYEHALVRLGSSTDASVRRRALAMRGLLLAEQSRFDQAIPLLQQAAAIYPEVAPFLRLRVVDAELAKGNLEVAAAMAGEIVTLSDTTAATAAALRLPGIHAKNGDRERTEESWRAAMRIPIDEITEPELVAMAKALAVHGRGDLATETRMRLLTDYTRGRYTEQTFDFVQRHVAALPVEQRLSIASKLARANRYAEALELFEQIPEGTEQARAIRLRALFNSRNYGRLLEQTGGVKLDDPALVLLRARAAWRDDRPAELLSGLAEVESRFPSSREAAEAKVLRAKYHVTDEIDYDRAIADLQAAIAAGAAGGDGENVWTLGWTYALAGKDDEALRTFERYVRSWPDGDWKTNSLFWSAKTLDRLGRAAERDAMIARLLAEYPFSYYSYRASELWPQAREARATRTSFPDLAADLATLGEPNVETVRELLAIDLPRDAAREMKALAQKYPSSPGVQFMLADVYVRSGEPFRANGVLQREFREFVRHGGENVPRRFWEILYPLEYWETIRAEAAKYGHDPFLMASIIRQESGFEPSTVSNAGAVGLMQIMPEEAPRIAAAAGLGAITRDDLFRPETNIAVGAAEYAQKLRLMRDNPVLAIAAYNAGESAVGTWIEKTPVEDIDLFVESIPYAETRLYVKTVTRNRFEYRRIYEGLDSAQQRRPQ